MEQSQAVGVPSKEATVFLRNSMDPLPRMGQQLCPALAPNWPICAWRVALSRQAHASEECHRLFGAVSFLVKWVLYLTTVPLMGFGLAG